MAEGFVYSHRAQSVTINNQYDKSALTPLKGNDGKQTANNHRLVTRIKGRMDNSQRFNANTRQQNSTNNHTDTFR